MLPPMWAIGDGTRNRSPGSHLPVLAELGNQCVHRVMAVQNAFRAAGGARRVENHPHRIRIQRGQPGWRRLGRGQRRAAAYQDNRGGVCHPRDDPGQHRRVVVSPEHRRHEDHPGVRVVEDEQQLMIPQRGQDGVDHHSGQGRREVDDRGLMPIGQHEGHDAAARHPFQHRRCQRGGLLVEAVAVDLAVAVDQHHPLGSSSGGVGERLGQRVAHPPASRIGLGGPLVVPADRSSTDHFGVRHRRM